MNHRAIRALYDDLPKLVREGVLTEEDAKRLRAHYGEAPEVSKATLAIAIFAALGTVLIVAGVLLLLAHNWDQLGRGARTVLSLSPLVLGQVFGAWVLLRRPQSTALCESASAMIIGGVGAAIALIAQTYHIAGDEAAFYLTWALLALPCVYLFRSILAALFYMGVILTWAGFAQYHAGHALAFWPLTLLLTPFLWSAWRKRAHALGTAWLTSGVLLYSLVGLGIVLEKALPGLWTISYASLIALMAITSRHAAAPGIRLPTLLIGYTGGLVLLTLLTFDWVWDDIGPSHFRRAAGYHPWAAVQDYVLCLALPAVTVIATLKTLRDAKYDTAIWAAFPFLTAAAYAAVTLTDSTGIALILMNAYMALAGIAFLTTGLRSGGLAGTNYGMLIIAMLAVTRFFDSDLGFLLRGTLFIIAGIMFLAINILLLRKGRGPVNAHE